MVTTSSRRHLLQPGPHVRHPARIPYQAASAANSTGGLRHGTRYQRADSGAADAGVRHACVRHGGSDFAGRNYVSRTGTGLIPDGPSSTIGAHDAADHQFRGQRRHRSVDRYSGQHDADAYFVGDVEARLISPGGMVSFPLFGRVGVTTATAFGKSNDLNGTLRIRGPGGHAREPYGASRRH